MIKLVALYIIRFVLSLIKIFPLKKKCVFFMSYNGTQYSCNPRAIYEYMDSHYADFTFVWCAKESVCVKSCSEKNNSVTVSPNSLKYFLLLISSSYVFVNIELPTYIPKKKNAVWVNTWHAGGAFKKVEYPSEHLYARVTRKIQARQTDFYISSCRKFTEVMSASTGISKEKFLEIGLPRNDVFFDSDEKKNLISKNVRLQYKIREEDFVLLYAPTFRGDATHGQFEMKLDIPKIKSALNNRFGKNVVFLVRSHHAIKNYFERYQDVVDVTSHTDMQELILAADALITDYSSCIYDFALTKKPAFLFTPDLEIYLKERGFYMNIGDWPYPYAETNDELERIILSFDEKKSREKINSYFQIVSSYDFGTACKELLRKIYG